MGGGGEGIVTEIVINMHTLLYLKYKPTRSYCVAQGMLLSVIGSLDRSRVWGRMDTCICMADSLCCPPETITTLLIGYAPIYNIKFKNLIYIYIYVFKK